MRLEPVRRLGQTSLAILNSSSTAEVDASAKPRLLYERNTELFKSKEKTMELPEFKNEVQPPRKNI